MKFVWRVYFFAQYIANVVLAYFPSAFLRKTMWRVLGMKIGVGSKLSMGQYVLFPHNIRIGSCSHINRSCLLDGRGGITIGNSVSISHRVVIMTGSHDVRSSNFAYEGGGVMIGDYAWIGVGATILKNVIIGRGAVVAAGSVVTKDVAPYSIVAGVPAKKIGERRKDLDYKCCEPEWFL